MEYYHAIRFGRFDITKIEIIRETESFVFIKSRLGTGEERRAKKSAHDYYSPTWEDARSWLLEYAKDHLASHLRQVSEWKEKVEKIEAMKP